MILPLTPAPYLNGAIATLADSYRDLNSSSGMNPVTLILPAAKSRISPGGKDPAISRAASGTAEITIGQTSCTNHVIASTFGRCRNPPTKSSLAPTPIADADADNFI